MCARYLDARRGDGLGRRDWFVIGGLYVVASLMKEQGLVLPALLVAIEVLLVNDRPRSRSFVAGYAALAGIAAIVLAVRHAVLGEFAGTFVAEALLGLGVGGRALTMLTVVPEWGRLFLWPAHLRGDYSAREIVASTGFGPHEALGLAIILGVVIAAFALRKRSPVTTLGVAWCVIALLPVSNVIIPTGIVLAERTLFLPSIGVVLAIGGLLELIATRVSRSTQHARFAAAAQAMLGAFVLLGVVRSAERQRVWRNEAFFIARSVQDDPLSFRMQQAYGDLLYAVGRPELGREAYDRAMNLAPRSSVWRVRDDFAKTLGRIGDEADAVEQLRASLAQAPRQEYTRAELIAAELELGRYIDAHREADTAIALGENHEVFAALRDKADDAAQRRAPPGSVKIAITMGDVFADRGP